MYANQDPKRREELWQFLSAFLSGRNEVAVIFGDFNDVRNAKERRGSVMDEKATRNFNEFICNNNLIEVKTGGSDFTWIQGGGLKLSKLDRFLVTDNYGNHWPNFESTTDHRLFSDHKPIILKHPRRNYGGVPFKFFNTWLGEEECNEIVKETWEKFQIEGNHLKIFIITQKLKAIKERLKVWAVERRLKKEKERKQCMDRLEAIDNVIDSGQGSVEIAKERLDIISKIRAFEKKEGEDIAQKNKNKWCLEGDENTALYHRVLNKKKHKGGVKGIEVDGMWETKPLKVKEHFKKYYEDIFKKDVECNWRQELGETNRITDLEKADLEKDFEEKEIKEAIWGCGRNKSPGPDGFTIEFFKTHWEIVKSDLVVAYNEFNKRPKIPKGTNSAFITLIPKVNNPSQVKDFRPISLISSVYKILSKLLANRLKKVLPRIIDRTQSAFVKNRQITDGPLMVNEVVDWARAKKKSMFVFKSDIAKAYDSVSWDYLDSMLEQKGFGEKWCSWVRECLRSGTSSVLINASPSAEFSLGRGLHQGDPIAPFLFTLVMEGLNEAVKKAMISNTYCGINVGDLNVPLSHLFFADDSIFFGKWSVENILNLVRILFCFQKAAGLRVNLEKSSLFGIGQTREAVESMALIIGCKAEKFPAIFLGLPIGVNMGLARPWRNLIAKFRSKLSNWKVKTLSIGGRHTIICNILGSLGNFLFSLFKVPKGVLKTLERLRRKFFWGGEEECHKIPWVKWNNVLRDKDKGAWE